MSFYPQPTVTGHLVSTAEGVMEGTVIFPVRGVFEFLLYRQPADRIGERAKLVCKSPYAEATACLFQPELDEPGGDYWATRISVEGYVYEFRGRRAKDGMDVEFRDVIQPQPPVPRELWTKASEDE
jgi:hypothetical protein